MTSTCKVEGCTGKHRDNGYCNRHSQQFRKFGYIIEDEVIPKDQQCSIDDCEKKKYRRGMCRTHWKQWMAENPDLKVGAITECKVEGCTGKHSGKGFCRRHLEQYRIHGKVYGNLTNSRFDPNPHRFESDVCIMSLTDKMGTVTKEFLIDKEDYDRVKDCKWGSTGRYVYNETLGRLHWYILGIEKPSDRNIQMDHINMDKLDNRKCNLRICTQSQNKANVEKSILNTSGYKGVFRAMSEKWRAQIRVEGKAMHLGVYPTKEEAAESYNVAAEKHFGEFAQINQI